MWSQGAVLGPYWNLMGTLGFSWIRLRTPRDISGRTGAIFNFRMGPEAAPGGEGALNVLRVHRAGRSRGAPGSALAHIKDASLARDATCASCQDGAGDGRPRGVKGRKAGLSRTQKQTYKTSKNSKRMCVPHARGASHTVNDGLSLTGPKTQSACGGRAQVRIH